MTTQEIKNKISSAIRGQGTNVDGGGALADILEALADSDSGLQFGGVLEPETAIIETTPNQYFITGYGEYHINGNRINIHEGHIGVITIDANSEISFQTALVSNPSSSSGPVEHTAILNWVRFNEASPETTFISESFDVGDIIVDSGGRYTIVSKDPRVGIGLLWRYYLGHFEVATIQEQEEGEEEEES